ncbi:MAG: hypothetical protein R3E48_08790 [Burkholderiaceae bacterium]
MSARCLIAFALAMALMPGWSPPVHSAPRAFCEKYAASAVRAYRDSVDAGCGFDGNRWHADQTRHLDWCIAARGTQGPQAERRARAASLGKCHARWQRRCYAYAKKAAEQYQTSRMLACGFTGSRWHDNKRRHSKWCESRGGRGVQAETRARAYAIEQCIARRK